MGIEILAGFERLNSLRISIRRFKKKYFLKKMRAEESLKINQPVSLDYAEEWIINLEDRVMENKLNSKKKNNK